MKITIITAVVLSSLFCSGCFSVSTNLPQHHGWNHETNNQPNQSRLINQKPSLSILVKREDGTEPVDDARLKTIQTNLKDIFRQSSSFSRISTGTSPEPTDYSIELVFTEFYLQNNGVLCAGKEQELYSFWMTLGIIPARIARYDSSYLLTYKDTHQTLFSKGLYHKDTWYGWPCLVFAPFVDPFSMRPTSKSILISLIQDIQYQGGFSDLNLNIK